MSEAIGAVKVWTRHNLLHDRIVCIIDPENIPSIALASRCGFTLVSEALNEGHKTLIFSQQIDRN